MIKYFKLTHSTDPAAKQPSFICSRVVDGVEQVLDRYEVRLFTSDEGSEGYFVVDFNGSTPTIDDCIYLQDGDLSTYLEITGFSAGSIVDGGEYHGTWTPGGSSIIDHFTRMGGVSPNHLQWEDLATQVSEKATITMTTTDPGEGVALDANNFIAVYTR